jgi:hypothetical protein
MFISHVIAITQLPIFIAPGIGGLRANGWITLGSLTLRDSSEKWKMKAFETFAEFYFILNSVVHVYGL